jgi:hypothetical protein
MLVNKLECYRYYSDFAGFDMIVIVENGEIVNLESKLDDIIGTWYDAEEEIGDLSLSDYIINELEELGVTISLYFNMD